MGMILTIPGIVATIILLFLLIVAIFGPQIVKYLSKVTLGLITKAENKALSPTKRKELEKVKEDFLNKMKNK